MFAVTAEAVNGSAAAAVVLCIEWLASSWAAVTARADNDIGDAGDKVLMSLLQRNQRVSALIAGA